MGKIFTRKAFNDQMQSHIHCFRVVIFHIYIPQARELNPVLDFAQVTYTDLKKKRPVFKWIVFALKQISKTCFRYV